MEQDLRNLFSNNPTPILANINSIITFKVNPFIERNRVNSTIYNRDNSIDSIIDSNRDISIDIELYNLRSSNINPKLKMFFNTLSILRYKDFTSIYLEENISKSI